MVIDELQRSRSEEQRRREYAKRLLTSYTTDILEMENEEGSLLQGATIN